MKKNSVMSKIMAAVIAVLTVAIFALGSYTSKLNGDYVKLQTEYESLRAHDYKMQTKVNDYELEVATYKQQIKAMGREAAEAEVVEDTFISNVTNLFNK